MPFIGLVVPTSVTPTVLGGDTNPQYLREGVTCTGVTFSPGWDLVAYYYATINACCGAPGAAHSYVPLDYCVDPRP